MKILLNLYKVNVIDVLFFNEKIDKFKVHFRPMERLLSVIYLRIMIKHDVLKNTEIFSMHSIESMVDR